MLDPFYFIVCLSLIVIVPLFVVVSHLSVVDQDFVVVFYQVEVVAPLVILCS